MPRPAEPERFFGRSRPAFRFGKPVTSWFERLYFGRKPASGSVIERELIIDSRIKSSVFQVHGDSSMTVGRNGIRIETLAGLTICRVTCSHDTWWSLTSNQREAILNRMAGASENRFVFV